MARLDRSWNEGTYTAEDRLRQYEELPRWPNEDRHEFHDFRPERYVRPPHLPAYQERQSWFRQPGEHHHAGTGEHGRPGMHAGETRWEARWQDPLRGYDGFVAGGAIGVGRSGGGERGMGHAGRGPKGYMRSDARVHEDICERLTEDPDVDASDIEVKVDKGEVTLSGMVGDRYAKHLAGDIAESTSGVREVTNRIRVRGAHRG